MPLNCSPKDAEILALARHKQGGQNIKLTSERGPDSPACHGFSMILRKLFGNRK